MKVEFKLDENYYEPQVVIYAKEMTEEIQTLINKLSKQNREFITGIKDYRVEIIDKDSIIRIFSLDGNVYALTDTKKYTLKYKLYELEELLDNPFARISNSEIVNLRKVKRFDLTLTGTIQVEFENGSHTRVSRRYVNKIKNILDI